MSVDDLRNSYSCWSQSPNDKQKISGTISLILDFISAINEYCQNHAQESCLFHSDGTSFLGLLALSLVHPQLQVPKMALERISADLNSCVLCIKQFYTDKIQVEAIDSKLKDMFDAWNLERLCKFLFIINKQLEIHEDDPQKYKELRKSSLFVIYEVLKYPQALQSPKLDKLFIDLIVKSQKNSSLKLADAVFPGMFILAAHQNQSASKWAVSCLSKATAKIAKADFDENIHFVLDSLISQEGFYFNREIIVQSLVFLLNSLDDECKSEMVDSFEKLAKLADSLIDSNLQKTSLDLYAWLIKYYQRVQKGSLNVRNLLFTEMATKLCKSPELQAQFRKMQLVPENCSQLNWIAYLLVSHPFSLNEQEHFVMIYQLFQQIDLNATNSQTLLNFIIKPSIQRMKKNYQTYQADWASRFLLLCEKSTDFTSVLLEFLIEDCERILSLKVDFKPLSNEIWQAYYKKPVRLVKFLKACQPMALLEINYMEPEWTSSILQKIQAMIPQLAANMKLSDLNCFFYAVSSIESIHFVARSIFQSDTLTGLLKSDSKKFWSDFAEFSNVFCDFCRRKQVLLSQSLLLVDLKTEMANLAYCNLVHNSDKILFSCKAFEFSEMVLLYSVHWASVTRRNSEVRILVPKVCHLLLIIVKSLKKVLLSENSNQIKLEKLLVALFKWFSSLDSEIRERTLIVAVELLRFTNQSEIELSEYLMEEIAKICEKKTETRLDDYQISYLENWKLVNPYKKPTINETVPYKGLQKNSLESNSFYSDKNPHSATLNQLIAVKTGQVINAADIKIPKSSSKPATKQSKLQQLKSQALSDTCFVPVKPAHFVKNEDPIEERSLKTLSMQVEPEKPKRQIKLIETFEGNIKKPKLGTSIPLDHRVGDLSNVHKTILRWTYPAMGDRPLNFEDYSLQKIPDQFSSVQEYTKVFEPLIILECWEHLVQARDNVIEEDFIEVALDSPMATDGFYDLTFKADFNKFREKELGEGDLVQMTHSMKRLQCLGLIKMVTGGPKEGMEFVLRTYPADLHSMVALMAPQSKWEVLNLFTLITMHREYLAITYLPMLSLKKEILKPNFIKYKPESHKVQETCSVFRVNAPQAEAVVAAVNQPSGFVLIQGPPGTGKTKTILSLIGSILTKTAGIAISTPGAVNTTQKTKKNMIMCCAPSNAACDEIVRRLKQGIIDYRGSKFIPKIVRVGNTESVHADVKDVALDLLVEEAFTSGADVAKLLKKNEKVNEREKEMRLKLQELNSERDSLREQESAIESTQESTDQRIQLVEIQSKIKFITTKRKELLEQLTAFRSSKSENIKALEHAKKLARSRILNDAQVVCCTLAAAGHELLTHANIEFPVVIVDEACQSVELSSLIPLKYGAKKCILVGDPNQLPPTVLSQLGQQFQYEQSLFQRIMRNVPNAVHLLSIQYRMHPDISYLPSLLFYQGKLENGPDLATKCTADWHSNSNFAPYRFYNVDSGQEVRTKLSRSVFNPQEVNACVLFLESLCYQFSGTKFAYRIGIITPYKLQVRKIKEKLTSRFGKQILSVVDVNTVDGFQGQEKDIIILSCVRGGDTRGIGFLSDIRRMNVALTRAKCSLFIFGNSRALMLNETWSTLVKDAEERQMITTFDPRDFETGQRPPTNIFE